MLVEEHKFRPITGRVLLCGKQRVALTEVAARDMLRDAGIAAEHQNAVPLDNTTRYGKESGNISDVGFFELLANVSVTAIDISDYEGAEIVHDLNTPVPVELHGKFDFIFNGGTMDNVFNPAVFMMNVSNMLKPGGRVLHVESSSMTNGAYLGFSPDLFMDYYAINEFADCKPYVGVFFGDLMTSDFQLYFWDPAASKNRQGGTLQSFMLPPPTALAIVIAERGSNSTADKSPVQAQYRQSQIECEVYDRALQRFANSGRPVQRYPFATVKPSWTRIKRYLKYRVLGFTWHNFEPCGTIR
jgi:SAM-dependent methyltransferase